ncbi:hypothetical protein ACO1PF_04655 [Alkalibacterium sp. f15]|uniref:hypothetical protein n=1 Tax=Alkalibacterium sp. f15 TaxID=3414029 RepID=UPI003BF7BB10
MRTSAQTTEALAVRSFGRVGTTVVTEERDYSVTTVKSGLANYRMSLHSVIRMVKNVPTYRRAAGFGKLHGVSVD